MSTVPVSKVTKSPFQKSRKRCAVQGLINKVQIFSLLVDCNSLVTIIRADLWRSIQDFSEPDENEPDDFQGVTQNTLRILGITKLETSVGSLGGKHSH